MNFQHKTLPSGKWEQSTGCQVPALSLYPQGRGGAAGADAAARGRRCAPGEPRRGEGERAYTAASLQHSGSTAGRRVVSEHACEQPTAESLPERRIRPSLAFPTARKTETHEDQEKDRRGEAISGRRKHTGLRPPF